MGKVILYLATSLDGYIADEEGGYGFLEQYSDPSIYAYDAFLNRLGSLIMGRKSYELLTKMEPTWPYQAFKTYVYTRKDFENQPNIFFTKDDPKALIERIKAQDDKDIWLFGGSEMIDLFIKSNAIDEYWIYYVPEVLGKGIPLFKVSLLNQLELISVKSYQNIAEIKLKPKNQTT